jgi:hypothetical protein
MRPVRLIPRHEVAALEPCSQCHAVGCHWGQIARRPFCPDCQESLARGTTPALVVPAERRPCSVCGSLGVTTYLTFPLAVPDPLEIDLCRDHFRALVSRQLKPAEYMHLRHALREHRLSPEDVFLLHEAFYDARGHALQPNLYLG